MISIVSVLVILFAHWFADFFCQSSYMATNKSKNNFALLSHVTVYTSVMMISGIYLFANFNSVMIFSLITFAAHFVTDYISSRITSQLYDKKHFHNFFVVIGIDQFLHYTQLLLTYYFLTKGV